MHIRKFSDEKNTTQIPNTRSAASRVISPITPVSQIEPKTFSDEKLLELAQKFGKQARLWRQRFAGLLPEVNRRRLYQKKDCPSIFVFAKKLAGISEEQTRNVLNLDRQFQDFPLLHKILVNGEVSINKLIRVCSVLNKNNEEFWANQVKILSQKALETLVRDERILQNEAANTDPVDQTVFDFSVKNSGQIQVNFTKINTSSDQNSSNKPRNVNAELRAQPEEKAENDQGILAHPLKILKLQLAKDVTEEILELQRKGIDINKLLREFLQKRDQEIAEEKTALHKQAVERARDSASQETPKTSHYISVKIRNLLKKEFGTKCVIPTCDNPATPIHHGQRLALAKYHDPFFLAPLCTQHHQIAHSIDLKYQEKRRSHD